MLWWVSDRPSDLRPRSLPSPAATPRPLQRWFLLDVFRMARGGIQALLTCTSLRASASRVLFCVHGSLVPLLRSVCSRQLPRFTGSVTCFEGGEPDFVRAVCMVCSGLLCARNGFQGVFPFALSLHALHGFLGRAGASEQGAVPFVGVCRRFSAPGAWFPESLHVPLTSVLLPMAPSRRRSVATGDFLSLPPFW